MMLLLVNSCVIEDSKENGLSACRQTPALQRSEK